MKNDKRVLKIWRGLPGSGKSTLAGKSGGQVFEADQFFINQKGEYKFNPALLKKAHAFCFDNVEEAMMCLAPQINVANTFTQKWEMDEYFELARSHGYEVQVYHVKSDVYKNVHGVPNEAMKRMTDRWEKYEGELIIINN